MENSAAERSSSRSSSPITRSRTTYPSSWNCATMASVISGAAGLHAGTGLVCVVMLLSMVVGFRWHHGRTDHSMYVLAMAYQRITISDGAATPMGQVLLAGEVHDDEPLMPRRLRTMESLIISVVTSGHGRYVDGQGRAAPI